MSSLLQVDAAVQHVLIEVPAVSARGSGVTQRRSKLTAALFVQTVVLGWLAHPAASLTQLCQIAADRGLALISQGLAQRFTLVAARLLEEILATAVQTLVQSNPLAAGERATPRAWPRVWPRPPRPESPRSASRASACRPPPTPRRSARPRSAAS
jgi:hypothetical protein